ncbi:cupin domain-containing protein [Anaeromicropila herbilytica]
MSFGVLRVVNDDLIQSNTGFGSHPHKDIDEKVITFEKYSKES